jgi:hypothetical protein
LSERELQVLANCGVRDWTKYPPTLKEYLAYEERQKVWNRWNRPGVFVSFTCAGLNEMAVMMGAEKRFKAAGLI